MAQIERGKIKNGTIVFPQPLSLPEGIDVLVHIEPIGEGNQPDMPDAEEDFASLPFFGMWADREDIPDSAMWVRKERERWQRRTTRQS